MRLLVVLLWAGLGSGELFSSIVDLENLLETESQAVATLHKYIEAEEERLDTLRKLAGQPVVETHGMVSNPISAFNFIRGWINSPLMRQLRRNDAQEVLESLEGMPGKEDLEGAVAGLVRLQLTYNIPTKDLAYGYPVPGLGNGTSMSISDCYEIGKIMYREENYYYALEWLEEAWQKTMRSDHIDVSGKVDILDYLGWAYFKTGNIARAYWTAKRSMGLQGQSRMLQTMRSDHIDVSGKVDILDYLGWAYFKTGNIARAYWTAKRSMGLQGQSRMLQTMRSDHIDVSGKVDILDYLGWAYFKTGNIARAYWTAKRSMGLQGQSRMLQTMRSDHIDVSGKVDILDYLGWAYFKTGNIARAYWTAKRSMGLQGQSRMLQTMRSDHIDVSGKVDILDYLGWAYFKTGNIARAYWTAKRSMGLQDFDPDEHTRDNYDYFLEDLKESGQAVPNQMSDLPPLTNIPPAKRDEMKLYDDLCVKQETLSRDPPVSLFHDFIGDREIGHLIDLAIPKLARALVVDRTDGFREKPAEYRVAKNAWMRERNDEILDAVNTRISDTTGLDMASAEFLQMANYGIAGQYEPHFDMSTEDEEEEQDPYDDNLGNRIATVLIYMNNPLAGGGTVFGDLNLHVQPIKGSAVFWYNLHKNGTPDTRMRHAACPVLVGHKWVANKWIRNKGQELIRLCDIDSDV